MMRDFNIEVCKQSLNHRLGGWLQRSRIHIFSYLQTKHKRLFSHVATNYKTFGGCTMYISWMELYYFMYNSHQTMFFHSVGRSPTVSCVCILEWVDHACFWKHISIQAYLSAKKRFGWLKSWPSISHSLFTAITTSNWKYGIFDYNKPHASKINWNIPRCLLLARCSVCCQALHLFKHLFLPSINFSISRIARSEGTKHLFIRSSWFFRQCFVLNP